jgi:hypothetical protein
VTKMPTKHPLNYTMVNRQELIYIAAGGVLGWVAIYSYNAVYGSGSSVYVSISLIGSAVAGFLAARGERNPQRVGVGAALVGTFPILYLMYDSAIQMAGGLITDSAPWVFLVFGVLMVAILTFQAVGGLICGKAGGWLEKRIAS